MSDKIIFIADKRQYNACTTLFSASDLPAVYDHDLLHLFSECGRAHINLWSYLDEDAVRENDDLAYRLCDHLGTLAGHELIEGTFDLLDCCKDDFLYPFRYALNTATVVRRCLEDKTPRSVGVFVERKLGFTWDPPDPPPDIFNAVAQWCSEKAGVEIIPYNLGAEHAEAGQSANDMYQHEPHPESAAYKVLSVAHGLDVSERHLLLEHAPLYRNGLLHVCDRDKRPHMKKRSFQQLPFTVTKLRKRITVSHIQEHLSASPYQAPCITNNPHLGFIYQHILNVLRLGEINYRVGQFLVRATGARVAVLGYPVGSESRCMREGMAAGGIRTLAINHSGLTRHSAWKRHRDDRGALAVWGDWEYRVLEQVRKKGETMHKVGSLRPDIHILCEAARLMEVKATSTTIPPKIVLITSRISHLYIGSANPVEHWRGWDDLLNIIERHPEWEFVIKAHPRYDHMGIYRSERFRAMKNLTLSTGSIQEALDGAGVAVAINSMTTATLEPMARGIPLISIENAVFASERGQLECGAITVTSFVELEKMLRELLVNSSRRVQQIQGGFAFLKSVVRASGEEAVRNTVNILDELETDVAQLRTCPQSQWVLRVMLFIQVVMLGGTKNGIRERFRILGGEGKRISWASSDMFRLNVLSSRLIQHVLWQPWPVEHNGSIPSLRSMLTMLYAALPRAIKPSYTEYLRHLVVACELDVERECRSGRSSIVARILPCLISPARTIRRLKSGSSDNRAKPLATSPAS